MEFLDISTKEVFTIEQLKSKYKNISFPEKLEEVNLSDLNLANITIENKPEYNTETHFLRLSEPKLVNNKYVRLWEVVEKEIEIPFSITMRQFRLVLLNNGLLNTINNILNNMSGNDGEYVRIEWEYANEVNRNSPWVSSISQSIGISEQEIDQIFLVGSKL